MSANRAGASSALTERAVGFMGPRLRGLPRGFLDGPYNGASMTRKCREPRRQWTSMPRVSLNFNLPDSSATEALGHALARSLPDAVRSGIVQSGAVVYLQGELGAGKTTCVRSLLRSLGVTGLVRSPTYTLVETYRLESLVCVPADLELTFRYAGDARQAAVSAVTSMGSLWLKDLGRDTSLSFYVSNLT